MNQNLKNMTSRQGYTEIIPHETLSVNSFPKYMPRNVWAILKWKKTETFPIKIGNAFERNISSVSHLNKFYSKKEKNRMMRMIC